MSAEIKEMLIAPITVDPAAAVCSELQGHQGDGAPNLAMSDTTDDDPMENLSRRRATADRAELEQLLSAATGKPSQIIDCRIEFCTDYDCVVTARYNKVLVDACISMLRLKMDLLDEGIHYEDEVELINKIISLQSHLADNYVSFDGTLVFAE